MNSVYIISLIAVINANQQNELDQVYKYYDALVDVAEIKYGGDCQTAVDNLMGLLCDGFQYCTFDGDCLDKTQYEQAMTTRACGIYQEVDYDIEIHPSNQYAPTHISLTCEWTFLLTDGCTIKETEEQKIYYNDDGLITKVEDEVMSEHTECPDSGYDSEPTPEYPQETVDQDQPSSTVDECQNNSDEINKFLGTLSSIVGCDVDNLFDLLSDDFTLTVEGVGVEQSIVNKEEYKQDILEACDRLEQISYISSPISCNSVTVEWEIKFTDGCILKEMEQHEFVFDYQGLITRLDSTHIEQPYTVCPQPSNEYGSEPEEEDNEYDEDQPSSTTDECENNSDEINKFLETFTSIVGCNVDNLMDLFSDDFAHVMSGVEVEQSIETKEEYKQDILGLCDRLEKISYVSSPISCNSVTVEWEFKFTDGCTLKEMEEHEFVFNYQGLITRLDSTSIDEPSTVCPQPEDNEYGSEPEENNEYDESKPSTTTDECQNNSNGINAFFEASSSIVDDCGNKDYNADNLMALLSPEFIYNHIDNNGVYYTSNKDEYEQKALGNCNEFTKTGYVLSPISCNTVTVEWEFTLTNGCTMKQTEEREFVFGYQGLITQIDARNVGESSTICPQPSYDEPSTTADCANNLDGIIAFFEALSSIAGYCNVDNLMGLLSDDFSQTHMEDGQVHHSLNKAEYQQEVEEFCLSLIKIEYALSPILCNSVTVEWELEFEGGCTMTKMEQREFVFNYQGLITRSDYQGIGEPSTVCTQPKISTTMEGEYVEEPVNEYKEKPSTTAGYQSELGFDAMVKEYEQDQPVVTEVDGGAPVLIRMSREEKLKSFYEAAFECRLERNKGNTEKVDTFMNYLSDSAKLCVVNDDNGNDETCYNKDKIRGMMGDRYSDDNESIEYEIEIISNDGDRIESKCTSQKRKSNGCIVIKEEYDTCLFNTDGSITEFIVNRSNRRIECDNYEDQ